MPEIVVGVVPPDFADWDGVLGVLHAAFASMEGRIDPPSSLHGLTVEGLQAMAQNGVAVVAQAGDQVVGCGFGEYRENRLYLSKLGCHPDFQRRGILREIINFISHLASSQGLERLTLGSRVELTETHAAFKKLGFAVVGGASHPGYDRVTSLTFEKRL